MKLDLWEAIFDLLDAGGKFDYGRYILANNNGKLHREDGPAAIESNGTQCWYRDGVLHREDGPAFIYPDGRGSWYRNGAYQHKVGWISET